MKCKCGKEYTEDQFNELETSGHNIIYNFDYKRCACGAELSPLRLNEAAIIGGGQCQD